MQCPNCGNALEFLIEKSPFGKTQCCRCKYKDEHRVFNQDIVTSDRTTVITNSALGLKIAGKNEDYISIALYGDKANIIIDGELNYINSIKLNKLELEILIYKLTEIHGKLDN
jgi:uncharacterized paraquat-inducible protein A